MDKKLSDLPIKNTPDGTEYVHILDPNDLSDSPEGTDKRVLLPTSTGGGGSQTLQQVSDTGGLSNGSTLKQGTTNANNGGNKGIALKCSLDYEFKWEAGRLYVMEQDGFLIRETRYNFTNVPAVTDDSTKGFTVGSRWILDNGDFYLCTDATTGSAVWELQNIGLIGTTTGNDTTDPIKINNLTIDNPTVSEASYTIENPAETFKRVMIQSANGDVDFVLGKTFNASGSENYFGLVKENNNADVDDVSVLTIPALRNYYSAGSSLYDGKVMKAVVTVPFATVSNFPTTGLEGVIYLAVNTQLQYIWQNNQYGIIALTSDIANVNTNSIRKDTVKLSEAINKGQAVYVSGANGTNILVSKASNTSEATSSKTIGLLETSGSTNAIVNVVTDGILTGLNTSTATIGDPVWLGVSGNLIYGLTNKPYAPAHLVYIGVVTRVSSTVGEILIKVQNGFELKEIHDVAITSVADKQLLSYDNATSLWKNKSVTTADIADSSNKRYVTDSQQTVIGNTSGTNTGDQDLTVKLTKSGDTITGDIGNTSTGFLRVASGTTAQRPGTPLDGMVRYNTTTLRTEFYSNGSWRNMARLEGDTFTGSITATNLSGTNTGDQDLSLLQTLYFKDATSPTPTTGVTSNTIIRTITIAANTFAVGSEFDIKVILKKTGVVAAGGMQIYTNTSNSLTGATSLGLYNFGATQLDLYFKRTYILKTGNNLMYLNNTVTAANDDNVYTFPRSTVSWNPAVINYLMVVVTPLSALDSYNTELVTLKGTK